MLVGDAITSFPLLRIHIRLDQRIMSTRRHAWRRNLPHSLQLQVTASNTATLDLYALRGTFLGQMNVSEEPAASIFRVVQHDTPPKNLCV